MTRKNLFLLEMDFFLQKKKRIILCAFLYKYKLFTYKISSTVCKEFVNKIVKDGVSKSRPEKREKQTKRKLVGLSIFRSRI